MQNFGSDIVVVINLGQFVLAIGVDVGFEVLIESEVDVQRVEVVVPVKEVDPVLGLKHP